MNCREFENIIGDLAANRLMEAGKRRDAATHAESCPTCAARLSGERSLTDGLRALAEADDDAQAPPRVKASLQAAFRNRHAVSEPVMAIKIAAAPSRRMWRPLAAAAALIVAATGAVLLLILLKPVSNEPPMSRTATPVESVSPPPANPPRTPSVAEIQPPNRPDNRPSARRKPVPSRRHPAPSVETAEFRTDFIPLTYVADSTAVESGQVVRVKVSRRTLLSMGLPVNVYLAGESVEAEVFVGDDGVARSIRLLSGKRG